MFYIQLILGKIIVFLIKIIDKNRGTDLPGKIILKINKKFPLGFKSIDYDKVVFITGTNGKSTTTNIVSHVIKESKKNVLANLEGANLIAGITTSLIKNAKLNGRLKSEYFVFEIDERSLKGIYDVIPAKHLVITNLQKDQSHRNGDPDFIYRKVKEVVNNDMTLYLNNEEPRSKSFEDFSKNVKYYGVDKNEFSRKHDGPLDITMPCPKCNHKIHFDYFNIDNVGKFSCLNCSFKSEENLKHSLSDIDFEKEIFKYEGENFSMPYNVPFMLYNYSLCILLCENFGISKEDIKKAFQTFINVGGRIENIRYKGKSLKYIRIKQENPETLQSALDIVAADKKEKTFILGLCIIKDEHPFYTNTFYAYDCNFTPLVNSGIKKYIAFSKYVSYDTANRFIYEGVDRKDIATLNTDDVKIILDEVDKAGCDNIYLITWLKTFNDIKKYVKENNLENKPMEENNG